jgi:carboxyl-terminal processing protease
VTLAPLLLLLTHQTVAPPDFGKTWEKTAQSIQRSYYARESRKAEMEARLKQYAPLASKATSKEEFRDTVEKMIGEFKDSHFDLYTDADQGYYMMDALGKRDPTPMPEIGAWFKKTPFGFVVQMVLNGSAAEKAGLQKGDLVATADGQPFSPVDSLRPDVGKKVNLHIRRGAKELDIQADVASESALKMFLDATRASSRTIAAGSKKIGYIHLWTQANEDFKNTLISQVYNQLRDTDGFILDLRDGFGGRPEGYGDPFFRPEVNLDWKYPKGNMRELFGYQRPLVVLINGGSRSAKEVLSYIFKKSHRATLIGSNTAGNVLGTSPMRLNDWAILEIPMVEVYADGKRLEGVGVSPDIQVPREFDDSGKDLYIEAALEVLKKKTYV